MFYTLHFPFTMVVPGEQNKLGKSWPTAIFLLVIANVYLHNKIILFKKRKPVSSAL